MKIIIHENSTVPKLVVNYDFSEEKIHIYAPADFTLFDIYDLLQIAVTEMNRENYIVE